MGLILKDLPRGHCAVINPPLIEARISGAYMARIAKGGRVRLIYMDGTETRVKLTRKAAQALVDEPSWFRVVGAIQDAAKGVENAP